MDERLVRGLEGVHDRVKFVDDVLVVRGHGPSEDLVELAVVSFDDGQEVHDRL